MARSFRLWAGRVRSVTVTLNPSDRESKLSQALVAFAPGPNIRVPALALPDVLSHCPSVQIVAISFWRGDVARPGAAAWASNRDRTRCSGGSGGGGEEGVGDGVPTGTPPAAPRRRTVVLVLELDCRV